MQFAALIPFLFLIVSFVGLKMPMTSASFIALLASTLIAQTGFHMTPEGWSTALLRTLELSVEIGLILLGAFLFLEVATKTRTLHSLAQLIREVSSNRVVQGILICFPMELLVEGSSGFGTPLLIITPILIALEFELSLCLLLPFLSDVVGVPFGALGTPIRLGFPAGSFISHDIVLLLLPLTLIAPLLSCYLIQKRLDARTTIWTLTLSLIYAVSAFFISKSGPEFSALGPALITFCAGLLSARLLFNREARTPLREWKGLLTYTLLILAMWAGKRIFMDQTFPGSHIRMFNPGFVFIAFSVLMLWIEKTKNPTAIFRDTFQRARKTLLVFLCLSFIVQELRESGALIAFNRALPDLLITAGAPLLGGLGSMMVGTSTVANLLLSKVVNPAAFAALGAGSAIGIQLAFQSLAAMQSLLNDRLTEKEIFMRLLPYTLLFIAVTAGTYAIHLF